MVALVGVAVGVVEIHRLGDGVADAALHRVPEGRVLEIPTDAFGSLGAGVEVDGDALTLPYDGRVDLVDRHQGHAIAVR